MGKVEAYPTATPTDRIALSLDNAHNEYAPVYSVFREYIKNLTFEAQGGNNVRVCNLNPDWNTLTKLKIDKNGCATTTYSDEGNNLLLVIGGIEVRGALTLADHPETQYTIEYTV